MADERVPFLLLHGFGQSAASWAEVEDLLADRLGGRCVVYAYEFPGHGEHASCAVRDLAFDSADFEMSAVCESVREFAQFIAENEGAAPVIVGYSMGGRIALECLARFGVELPVSALVLESAGFGPRDLAAREAFEKRNLVWAAQVREQGVEAFMEYWASLPLFASQANLSWEKRASLRAGRMANDAEALALTFEGTGQHRQALEEDTLSALMAAVDRGLPVAYLAGELDKKYAAIAADIAVFFGCRAGDFGREASGLGERACDSGGRVSCLDKTSTCAGLTAASQNGAVACFDICPGQKGVMSFGGRAADKGRPDFAQNSREKGLISCTSRSFVHEGLSCLEYAGLPAGERGACDRNPARLCVCVVPGAGHNVHLEAPESFVNNILCFLEKKAQ